MRQAVMALCGTIIPGHIEILPAELSAERSMVCIALLIAVGSLAWKK